MNESDCELCTVPGGRTVFSDAWLRVVAVGEAEYPGFMRVIWNRHVRELTDLDAAERDRLMRAVFTVEDQMRRLLRPHKMNVASLGNVTPHLHWHLIPRYEDDPHFPGPIWAARQRAPVQARLNERRALLPELEQAVAAKLAAG